MDTGPSTLPLSAAKHPNGDHLRGVTKQPKNPKVFDSHRLVFVSRYGPLAPGFSVQPQARQNSRAQLSRQRVASPPHRSRGPTPIPRSQSRNLLV